MNGGMPHTQASRLALTPQQGGCMHVLRTQRLVTFRRNSSAGGGKSCTGLYISSVLCYRLLGHCKPPSSVSPGVGNSAPGLFFKNCSRIAASRSASCFSLPVRSKPCRLSSALFLAFSSFLRAFSSSLRLASSSANLAASSSYCINFRIEK